MVSGKAKQGHGVPIHVRVESGVEPVQRRQGSGRAGVVLRCHERPQQPVDVLGSVPRQHSPVVASSEGAEGGSDVEEALRQDEAVAAPAAYFVRGLELRVVHAEGPQERRSSVGVVDSSRTRGRRRG